MTKNQINRKTTGVLVHSVAKKSPFYLRGVRGGDRILAINGEPINNELDFQFFSADYHLEMEVFRSGRTSSRIVERQEGQFTGITLVEAPIKRCANRCVFCFIDQMPRGLRKSLYVKDEDVRLSLINGNYVTMSNFKKSDLEQIARIGLSPLYISVHATDPVVRRAMLGNAKAADIGEQLHFLAGHGIRFHTQIVVCPTYNDGKILKKTVTDLLAFNDAVASIAVVPVGLTRYSATRLVPVDKEVAGSICLMITEMSDRATRRDGARKLFLADEFLIKAGQPIPPCQYYEDYPQIENGVGLVRQLLDESCKAVAAKSSKVTKRKLVLTSESAEPFVRKKLEMICTKKQHASITVASVHNRFFGATVTVAGLLTAVDCIKTVRNALQTQSFDAVVLPAAMFNYAGYTLDGYSQERIARLLCKPVHVAQQISEVL